MRTLRVARWIDVLIVLTVVPAVLSIVGAVYSVMSG